MRLLKRNFVMIALFVLFCGIMFCGALEISFADEKNVLCNYIASIWNFSIYNFQGRAVENCKIRRPVSISSEGISAWWKNFGLLLNENVFLLDLFLMRNYSMYLFFS